MVTIVAGSLLSSFQQLVNAHPKDAVRFQRNIELLGLAKAGNQAAIGMLGALGGIAPFTPAGSPGAESLPSWIDVNTQATGWATAAAQADAQQKYNSLLNGGISGSATVVKATPGTQASVTGGLGTLLNSLLGPTAATGGAAAGAAAAAQSRATLVQMAILLTGAVVLTIVVMRGRR